MLASIYDAAHTATVGELNEDTDYQRHRRLADEYAKHGASKETERHLLAMADMYSARVGNSVREAVSRLPRPND